MLVIDVYLVAMCVSAGICWCLCGVGGSCGLHYELSVQPAVHWAGGTGPDLRAHGEFVCDLLFVLLLS